MLNRLVPIVVVFPSLAGCWYLFYEKSLDLALLPISLPSFVYFMINGEPRFMWLTLLVYSTFLVFFFQYLSNRSKAKLLVAIVVFVMLHTASFLYLTKQFGEMGVRLGEQIIRGFSQ